MNSRKYVFAQTGIVLAGELILSAAMVAVFAVLNYYDTSVLLGGLAGSVIATLNFFLMAMSVELAADKAEQQDVRGGQALISLSYGFRLIALFVILVVCAKTEIFHLLALVIPLAFTRPVLTVAEFFKKKGERDS